MIEILRAERDMNKLNKDNFIHDVEYGYAIENCPVSSVDNDIIKCIDGSHIDENGVLIDKFGYRLYDSQFSTGCKGALLARYEHDKVIDTIECGHNAIEAIFNYCKNCKLLIHNF